MDPGGTNVEKHGGDGGSLPAEEAVIKKGYLKKLKTMKKKFFVLRGNTHDKSASLEYYDTEKKWKSNSTPKKSILLKNCYNITRRLDVRQKHVIALYTRKECLCVVAESEEELAEWLAALLELLHPEDALFNSPQPSQLIWQVNIQKKGLGASRNIIGNYTLQLTEKCLILNKLRPSKTFTHALSNSDYIEYSLSSIRRCGDSESFFYMEVGRSSATGAGELWMHTEDPNIAKSMHTAVLIAMSNNLNVKEEMDPKARLRSASATEASKPISVLTRRQTHQGTKSHGLSPSSVGSSHGILAAGGNVRERCDSLPSRNTPGSGGNMSQLPSHPAGVPHPHRPHSMYIRGISHSPPVNSPLSPHSAGAYSTDSAGSSVSIDETDNFSHHTMYMDESSHLTHARLINSRTPDERSIPEEVADESLVMWQPEKCLSESLEKNSCMKQSNLTSDKRMSYKSETSKDLHSLRKSSVGGPPDVGTPVLAPSNTGTSPQNEFGYMAISPSSADPLRLMQSRMGGNSSNHSGTSSLAEDVPDSGIEVEGYVDMEPHRDNIPRTMSPAASVSSVTSGTPSTDMRFSEYHLDKVSSYFPPEEDGGSRPLRAYSVGSKPDHFKKIINRHDIHPSGVDSSRTRAFSCGSKSRNMRDNRILNHSTPPHMQHVAVVMQAANNSKSSSTPVLGATGSLYRHNYNSSHSSVEPLDDLMEMDFSTNRTDSTGSIKTETQGVPSQAPLAVSPVAPQAPPQTTNNMDGYMDMAPLCVNSGYVEMKPGDSCPNDKPLIEAVRKLSVSKPHYDSNEKIPNNEWLPPQSTWGNSNNSTKVGSVKSRSRIPSLPIAINSSNPKELKNQTASSASPIFNMASMLKGDCERSDVPQGTPKMSPGTSPVTTFTPSPISSLKKSKKQHNSRRNSTELPTPTMGQPQTIFPFSPGSPVKYCPTKSPLYNMERKSDSSAVGENISMTKPFSIEKDITKPLDVSEYVEMAPIRLTTVKELNETCGTRSPVDKNLKQIMNNATKSSDNCKGSNVSTKLSSQLTSQRSVDESLLRNNRSPNSNTQANAPAKFQYAPIQVPQFSPTSALGGRIIDSNSKENQDILSSNPMANRTLMKPTVITNQIQAVKKPILVISQTQAIAADFKPIQAYDIEQKNSKSGSPKQCESALNRQLSYYDNKNRANKEDPCDGYEMLASQNGELQKVTLSRPGSVNTNKGRKDGGPGSRPPSVNSEGGGKEKSRPSSVSSEVSGTPCGSRPGSVVGEKDKLLYVSLDLKPSNTVSPQQSTGGICYTTIDFIKCEELKNSKNLAAKSTN